MKKFCRVSSASGVWLRYLRGRQSGRNARRIISHSGSSKSTVDAIRQARKSGTSVLCLTNQENALIGKWADLLLCTENRQMLYGNAIFPEYQKLP